MPVVGHLWCFVTLRGASAFNILLGVLLATFMLTASPAQAGPNPARYWQVDDVRPGLKGFGRTVMKGTKVETFDVEVLGVLKNTSPGRDMILCRLPGLGLEKTGVVAGRVGSPVHHSRHFLCAGHF